MTLEDLPEGLQQAESIPNWDNVLVMLVVLAMVIVLRKGRHNPINQTLPPHQRARPIALEFVLLGILIFIKLLTDIFSINNDSILVWAVTAGIGVVLGDANTRSIAMTLRFRRDLKVAAAE